MELLRWAVPSVGKSSKGSMRRRHLQRQVADFTFRKPDRKSYLFWFSLGAFERLAQVRYEVSVLQFSPLDLLCRTTVSSLELDLWPRDFVNGLGEELQSEALLVTLLIG